MDTRAPLRGVALLGVLLLVLGGGGCEPAEVSEGATYDLLIRGGTVVDGSGAEGFAADVGVRDGVIVRVAPDGIADDEAEQVLEAEGHVVAPGFVDHHAHIPTAALERPLLENFVRQGITTILAHIHSGGQPWPLDEHIARVDAAPNLVFFASHATARERVMGQADREPTEEELAEMKDFVEASMCQGALGLSTGLAYPPGIFAETDEVVELARVAARHGGIYITHMRNEFRGLVESVEEAIRIAREAEIPVHINHLKAGGPMMWGQAGRILEMVDQARAEGLDVKQSVYTYAASSPGQSVFFPSWALAGGRDSLAVRLEDPETKARIDAEMREILAEERMGDPPEFERIQFRRVAAAPEYEGRTLADLARDRGMPETFETATQLLQELYLGGFSAIHHVMEEEDLETFLGHRYTMIETDGDGLGLGDGWPHPRSYGSFPRVLARYVQEREVFTLEEAIRRMTSLSAEQIGAPGRGLIEEGTEADIVVFDPDRVRDLATFQDPHRFAVGFRHVVVNGQPVIRDASLTGLRPGEVLTGPARPDRVALEDDPC